MKNFFLGRQMITSIIGVAVIVIFITWPASAQEEPKQDPKKTVKVKIVKDVNGKKTVVDTVFQTDRSIDSKEMQIMLKGVEKEMKDVEKEMKDVNYTFGMSFPSECLELSGCVPPMSWESRAGDHMRILSGEDNEPTLADLLGDIPMERVKSYTIKDRKNGKRIIIEIDDAPLMEKQDRVIYIQGNQRHPSTKVQMIKAPREMKVVVETDDKEENPEKVNVPEKSE